VIAAMAEPAGAVVGYLLLAPFLTPLVMGIVLAAVAGIMVFISLDELLPTAEAYGHHHFAIYGLLAGMAVMALSLLLFV
jgi:ZIP family zinc transporter